MIDFMKSKEDKVFYGERNRLHYDFWGLKYIYLDDGFFTPLAKK